MFKKMQIKDISSAAEFPRIFKKQFSKYSSFKILRNSDALETSYRVHQKIKNLFAGNVSPVDVYSHIPGICEEKDIPYIFTPSREHLGLATGKILVI